MNEVEENYITQLRDCFNASYQFPQYCIDNNIKKPLFLAVSEDQKEFLWEVYAQFKYANRPVKVKVAFYYSDINYKIKFSQGFIISAFLAEKFTDLNLDDFDKVIILTSSRFNQKNDKFVYLDELKENFVTRTYCEIPLCHFMQKHPKVKLIVTNFLSNPKSDLEFEKKIPTTGAFRKLLRSTTENSKTLLGRFGYTNEELLKMIEHPKRIKNPDGSTSMIDDEHPLIHIKNGKRETAYQPEHYKNKIYFVGPSHYYGFYAPYDKTIESHLQKMLNDHNLPYRVENEAQLFMFRTQDIFTNLTKLNLKPNDIVFVYVGALLPKNIPFLDLRNAFEPYDYREIFVDKNVRFPQADHVNEIGYKIVADKIFEYLTENNFFQDVELITPPPIASSSLWYPERKFFNINEFFAKSAA